MKEQSFSLQPFTSSSSLSNCAIVGNITRYNHTLAICYELRCPLTQLAIPSPADIRARRDGLWQETCFELFLGVKDSPQYWEFNLSPAGHWNIYRFAAYRQGMQEELALTSLPFIVQKQSDLLQLSLELDLDKLVIANQVLEVAISAVIKPKEGEVSYWALIHPSDQADFHRRDSFILEL